MKFLIALLALLVLGADAEIDAITNDFDTDSMLDAFGLEEDILVSPVEETRSLWRWGRRNRQGGGGGQRFRGGGGNGGGHEGGHQELIQKLRQNRRHIQRKVKYNSPKNGVTTVTGSTSKPEINEWIYDHIRQMKDLVESGGRVRNWDGLFSELFDNAVKLKLDCDYNKDGAVECTHTGDTCYAEALTKAHAKVVSLFLANRDEMSKDHEYLIGDYDDECE